jgi:hypothetical protein
MNKAKWKVTITCFVVSYLLSAGIASGEPTFWVDSNSDWNSLLYPEPNAPMIAPLSQSDWDEYVQHWYLYQEEGNDFPTDTNYSVSQLYVYDGNDPCYLQDNACLVMTWGDQTVHDVNFSGAYNFVYGMDPDLHGCTITFEVYPTSPQISLVSFGLEDTSKRRVTWSWKVGNNAPIPYLPWPQFSPIKIDTSKIYLGKAAAVPQATGFALNPDFDLSNVANIVFHEIWYGHAYDINIPAPSAGGSGNPGWNAWRSYSVTKNVGTGKNYIKWSQPPVIVDTNQPPTISGWDERSVSNCWDCPTQCHGDADCSGYVDATDLNILVAAWNTHYGDANYNPCADFDRDGDVDTTDYQILQTAWHTYPTANCPSARAIVADDWQCSDNRPVTDIHWWGSFIGWRQPYLPPVLPKAFNIGIWTDVPKDPCKGPNDQNNFSHPGKLVWKTDCNNWVWNFAGYDRDPNDPNNPKKKDACFQFNQLLSQNQWFYQEPNDPNHPRVYWLSIAAVYDPQDYNNPKCYPWGWKTRQRYFNDDAVVIKDVNTWPPVVNKTTWKSGYPIKLPPWPNPNGVSWDVTFELTTNEPNAREAAKQYHTDINGDGIVNFLDLNLLARDWLTPDP